MTTHRAPIACPSHTMARSTPESRTSVTTPSRRRQARRRTTRRADAGADASASEGTRDVDAAKRAVLAAISSARQSDGANARVDVERAVATLENLGPGTRSANGTWTLAYSYKPSRESSVLESLFVPDEAVETMTKLTYDVFFKFAPWLAGSAETSRRGTRNAQVVDVARRRVRNDVDVDISDTLSLRIGVEGEIETDDEFARRASVTFTAFDAQLVAKPSGGLDFPKVSAPLPRPRGSLETTFCDESMRVSRGGRGGVFILTRVR